MSNDLAKYINSRRRHKTDVAVSMQLKIAKQHNSFADENKVLKEPHRLAKHHAMDCGNPHCYLCGNPRKTHKDKLTQQEKRLFQNVEVIRDTHSNGLTTKEDDE
jgi:diaminopimelate epimerase